MPPNRVSATETSLELLRALTRLDHAGVTDLANEVDGSKANVHKHLQTLESNGLVRRTDNGYVVGYRFLEFATAAKRVEPAFREGHNHLSKLADVSEATATLVVRDGTGGIYLHTVSSAASATGRPTEGDRAPLHELAGGLAILSCYPAERRRAVLSELVDTDDRVLTIQDRLETVRHRGTIVERDAETDSREVAAPVTADDGTPLAAVGLWEPDATDEAGRIETDLRSLVRTTATTVSNRLSLTR
jgi:DNA-binding IclR family transcriptional regulator